MQDRLFKFILAIMSLQVMLTAGVLGVLIFDRASVRTTDPSPASNADRQSSGNTHQAARGDAGDRGGETRAHEPATTASVRVSDASLKTSDTRKRPVSQLPLEPRRFPVHQVPLPFSPNPQYLVDPLSKEPAAPPAKLTKTKTKAAPVRVAKVRKRSDSYSPECCWWSTASSTGWEPPCVESREASNVPLMWWDQSLGSIDRNRDRHF